MQILSKIFGFLLHLLYFIFSSLIPIPKIFRMGSDDASSLKPVKFQDLGFARWQEHLEAWLITLSLISAVGKDLPYSSKGSFYSDSNSKSLVEKSSKKIEFHCRFRILSCLSDELYEKQRTRLYKRADPPNSS